MDITPRDLTALTPAQLENLGTIFIDELVRRKLKINILNRFSNQVLWDLAFSILDVFKQRHEAGSDEVKREFEQIHLQIVRTLFPEILKAATIPFKFMPILEKMKPFVKLVRKGVRPKARRNEIIRDCLETNGLTDSQVYPFLQEHHPELLKKGTSKQLTDEDSVWRDYRRWRAKQTPKA